MPRSYAGPNGCSRTWLTPYEALQEFDLKPNTSHKGRDVEAVIKVEMMKVQRAYGPPPQTTAKETP